MLRWRIPTAVGDSGGPRGTLAPLGRRGAALFLLLVLTAPALAADEKTPRFKPLFPVKLDHAFPAHRETVAEVRDLILKQYYSPDIDAQALDWAAVQGMLRHISPPENPGLSRIWPPAQYARELDTLKGEQLALGIKSAFNPADGSLSVTEVLPDSPAAALLHPRDRIMRIDGRSLAGMTLPAVQALLAGEAGEAVTLTLVRDIEVFNVTLKFRRFDSRNLVVTPLDDGVVLVEIKSFTAGVAAEIQTGLRQMDAGQVSGLIIDLRNNSGGVMVEALKTAELFLPPNHILMRILQRDRDVQNYVSANDAPLAFDIAILVNGRTASSAEIVPACLRDHQKALVIGTRTFGKGIVEKIFELKNGMHVKFITGAIYSPKGNSWHARGLTPDFLVEQDARTLEALYRVPPRQRFRQDVAAVTAFKLLARRDR